MAYALFIVFCRVFIRHSKRRLRLEQSVMGGLLRFFCFMIRALGLARVEVSGREHLVPGKSYLILVNHPTLIDAPVLLSIFPDALCVVKSAIGSRWMYRTACSELGFLILGDSSHLIESAVDALSAGRSILLFPEGTRSFSDSLRPFERGAATIFIRSVLGRGEEIEILPVTITCNPPSLARGQRWFEIPERRIDFRVAIKYPFRSENILSIVKPVAVSETGFAAVANGNHWGTEVSSAKNQGGAPGAALVSQFSRSASVELTNFLQNYFEEQLFNEQRSGQ